MTFNDFAGMCGGRLLSGDPARKAGGVSIDSRTIEKDQVFLALKGENFDGHDFAETALEKGAAAVVGQRRELAALAEKVNRNAGLIEIEEPLEALHQLARAYRSKFDIDVIVVTGSCGKTTTKDMLAAILGQSRKTVATQGNLNNLIGAPLMLLRIDSDTEAAVIEIASNAPGEIERLTRIIEPTAGIITNIGPVHLEGFGTLEGVFKEKTSIAPYIRSNGFVVVNEKDIPVGQMASIFSGRIITFGLEESADFHATDIRQDIEKGTEFLLNNEDRISIHMLGRHNVLNALAATATAVQLGADIESVRQGLERFSASAMRMETCEYHGAMIINDAYNANPRAMREAISTLGTMPAKRRILALGDMLELGECSSEEHFSLGSYIGETGADLLYLYGNFRTDVRDGAVEAGMQSERIHCCDETGEIAVSLKYVLGPGDILLVKGSRGMQMERVVAQLVEES